MVSWLGATSYCDLHWPCLLQWSGIFTVSSAFPQVKLPRTPQHLASDNPLITLEIDAFFDWIETCIYRFWILCLWKNITTLNFCTQWNTCYLYRMENVTFCTPTPSTIIIACDFIITIGILYLIDYPFCTWSGSVASNKEGIPTLVFVALNGYHGVAKYSWSLNNEELEEQVHSIMYTKYTSVFECTNCHTKCGSRKGVQYKEYDSSINVCNSRSWRRQESHCWGGNTHQLG